MSFINSLIDTSTERSTIVEELAAEKKKRFEESKSKRIDEILTRLTEKYHPLLKKGLNQAAHAGRREKYMNFERDDFKANFPTLGTPGNIALRWLQEMIKEASPYLPFKGESEEREHFKGLEFDIWNNKAFTIHLKW